MRKTIAALLMTTALCGVPDVSHAGPVAALFSAGGLFAAGTIGGTLFQIGASLLVSTIFAPEVPAQPDNVREMAQFTSRPAHRYVYGRARMTGTPLPFQTDGQRLYGALLLNSRPSAGGDFTIYADKRVCSIEQPGDIYDMAGPGVGLLPDGFRDPFSNNTAFQAWISLGDHDRIPQPFIDSGIFLPTDLWRGRTVLWVLANSGGSLEKFVERWPSAPPLFEIEMDFSRVWDPRDQAQDPDDASTWGYSANQALVALDAIRRNPIGRYSLDQIHLPSFIEGADAADEQVARRDGSFEPRYQANGIIVWRDDRELLQQVEPLAQAGAGRFMRIGGLLGYAAGVNREVVYTATDLVESGVEYERVSSSRDKPRAIRTSYTDPLSDWQLREIPLIGVGGPAPEVTDDARNLNLPFVISPTQAMRVQQIEARRLNAQRRLKCTLPPSSIVAVSGSIIQTDFPEGWQRWNGRWIMEEASPVIEADDLAVFSQPVSLKEDYPFFYEWDPETDELELEYEDFTAVIDPLAPPGLIDTITTGYRNNGGAVVPYIRFAFDPTTASVDHYDWQFRKDDLIWQTGGVIDDDIRDGFGQVFEEFYISDIDASYDIRVRAVSGRVSEWVQVDNIIFDFALTVSSAVAGPGAGEATFDVTGADADIQQAVSIRRASVGDEFSEATTVAVFDLAPGETRDLLLTGLPSGDADFWAVPVTQSGSAGLAVGPYTLTIS